MINLLNKILSRFNLKLVSTKPDTRLVDETVKYLNRLGDLRNDSLLPPYVGDIVYLQERVKGEFPQVSGKTYFQHQVLGKDKTFFNFDGEKYTTEELEAKLK